MDVCGDGTGDLFERRAGLTTSRHTQQEANADALLLFDWDNTFWGTNVLLANLTGQGAYHAKAQYYLKYWVCGTGGNPIQYTPLGRAWNANGGELGTSANAVFLSNYYGNMIRCGGCRNPLSTALSLPALRTVRAPLLTPPSRLQSTQAAAAGQVAAVHLLGAGADALHARRNGPVVRGRLWQAPAAAAAVDGGVLPRDA